MDENGRVVSTAKGDSPGTMGCKFTLADWQMAHPEINFRRKVDIPGHQ